MNSDTNHVLSTSPTGIQKWKVLSQEQVIDEEDSDAKSHVVLARIESMSVGRFPVTKTWSFDVWESDELFEYIKRSQARTDQLIADSQETINKVNALAGRPSTPPEPPGPPPNRNEVTSRPYCIRQVKDNAEAF